MINIKDVLGVSQESMFVDGDDMVFGIHMYSGCCTNGTRTQACCAGE